MKFLKNYYIYDTRTNIMAKVEPVVYEILKKEWNGEEKDEIDKKYSKELIKRAREEIEKAREKYHVFSIKRDYFKDVKPPFTEEDVIKKLENNLNSIILNITDDCNLNCSYCKFSGIYRDEWVHKKRAMPEEMIEKALNFLKEHSREEKRISIGFYGGEPLLEFDKIVYTVKKAKLLFKDKKIKFSLTTNGFLLDRKEIVDFLVKNNFITFVSIDGPEYIHNRYRERSFNVVYNNLLNIKKKYPSYFKNRIGYSVVLSPPYRLKDIKTFMEGELKSNAPILMNFVNPFRTDFYSRFKKEELNLFEKQEKELFEEFLEKLKTDPEDAWSEFFDALWGRKLSIIHNRPQGAHGDTLYIGGICIPGFQRLFVDPEGFLYPCERVHYHLKIGSLEDGFFYHKIFKTINRIVKMRERCKRCWVARLCDICFTDIIKNERFDQDIFDKKCKIKKRYFEKILNFYGKILDANEDFLNKIKGG